MLNRVIYVKGGIIHVRMDIVKYLFVNYILTKNKAESDRI